MTLSYRQLSDNARVWIYQCQRHLSREEVSSIKRQALGFLQKWSAHGAKLNSDFEIFHNQFLVFFVDEKQAKAGGCSIDKSVRLIKSLENEFGISLLDRNLIAYRDKNEIATCAREEFAAKVRSGALDYRTIVFNNLVATKKEFESGWEVPLSLSWHKELVED